MSFVIGDVKRELNFHMNQTKPVGPNVGPGSYHTPQRYNSLESKAPFGSGSRRRLQAPFMEFFQDMQQFIFLQPKTFQTQHMMDKDTDGPQKYNSRQKLNHRRSSQHSLTKLQSMNSQSINSTQLVKPNLERNAKSLNTSSIVTTQLPSNEERQRKKIRPPRNNNLGRILGMMNVKKGSVSIQSQNVRVLEDEEENQQQDNQEDGSFFLTQQDNKKPNINQLKNQLVKAVNQNESIRSRMDKKIIKWKNEDSSKKPGFLMDVINGKNFMKDIGPGSYDVVIANEVNVDYKMNPSSNFISNTQRLTDLGLYQNKLGKLNQTQQQINGSIAEQQMEQTQQNFMPLTNEQFDIKKRSISQINGYQSLINQGSQFRLFKNGKLKDAPTREHLLFYKDLEEKQQKKNKNPNIRMEFVNKEQVNLRNIGPGSYNITNQDQANEYISGKSPFGQAERFQDFNKKIQEAKRMPGPGYYSKDEQVVVTNSTRNLSQTFNGLNSTHDGLERRSQINSMFGPFKIPDQNNTQSFGTTQKRDLQLIHREQKNLPGPGFYNQNQEDVNLQIQQIGDKELAKAYFHIKQSSVFQSKAPRMGVQNKVFKGQQNFYDNKINTISKTQIDIVTKRLDKITYSAVKDYPYTNKELQAQSQIVDTFQTVDKRFKEDKRLTEMQYVGPGSYYKNDIDDKLFSKTNSKTLVNQKSHMSSMFKSQVQRIDQTSQRDHKINAQESPQNLSGIQKVQINEHEVPDRKYQSTLEKKSFNMKYSQSNGKKK